MSSQSLSTIEAHSSMVAKGKKLKMLLQLQVRFSQNGRLADCLLSSCTTFSIFVIHTLFLYHWKGLFLLFPVIYIYISISPKCTLSIILWEQVTYMPWMCGKRIKYLRNGFTTLNIYLGIGLSV